ncbi:hypothetical protein [Clostridium sp.]|uniref:hypothetical protein n=1 Tax=Clostridium sp. TaxID=1506 RepID=UPI001B701719|nr:hypothetical protein [Clostridium sp.]MBP3916612.1 hypothetical protein [Clostridium sp.]
MKTKVLEKKMSLCDLEIFLEEDDEFLISKTEVILTEDKEDRYVKDLNYIYFKTLGIKIQRCEYQIYNPDTEEYEYDHTYFIITDVKSDKEIYESEEEVFTDALIDYLNYIQDDEALDNLDELTCEVIKCL